MEARTEIWEPSNPRETPDCCLPVSADAGFQEEASAFTPVPTKLLLHRQVGICLIFSPDTCLQEVATNPHEGPFMPSQEATEQTGSATRIGLQNQGLLCLSTTFFFFFLKVCFPPLEELLVRKSGAPRLSARNLIPHANSPGIQAL